MFLVTAASLKFTTVFEIVNSCYEFIREKQAQDYFGKCCSTNLRR